MHYLNPAQFPRSAQTAYFIDPEDLLAVHKEIRESGEDIKMIYHSHIDADSYFSKEDERLAVEHGQPVYPGVDYLIVSVVKGEIKNHSFYGWDNKSKKYIQKND